MFPILIPLLVNLALSLCHFFLDIPMVLLIPAEITILLIKEQDALIILLFNLQKLLLFLDLLSKQFFNFTAFLLQFNLHLFHLRDLLFFHICLLGLGCLFLQQLIDGCLAVLHDRLEFGMLG